MGPVHGGVNESVIRMLNEIGNEENIKIYLDKAKDKSDPFRLMGLDIEFIKIMIQELTY